MSRNFDLYVNDLYDNDLYANDLYNNDLSDNSQGRIWLTDKRDVAADLNMLIVFVEQVVDWVVAQTFDYFKRYQETSVSLKASPQDKKKRKN